eukprot:508949_1
MSTTGLTPAIVSGFCISCTLTLGHVFGLFAAQWSMDILDYYTACMYENQYEFVNGDFSEALYGFSWAGLVVAVLLYGALIIGDLTRSMSLFYVVLCIYIIIYIAWVVILFYIFAFFNYIYITEERLQQTCGGLSEIRNIWWACFGALIMVLPACCGCCYYAVGSKRSSRRRA